MQRRSFLVGLTAGAMLPILPALSEAPAPAAPWSTARLTEEMYKMFRCRTGDPRAFMELVKGISGVPWVELNTELQEDADTYRITYATFAYGVEGGTPEAAEAQLAEHFYNQFLPYAKDNPLLYWRLEPQFESAAVNKWGDVWATSEELEDEFKFLADKPADVELEFNSGNYRYVTERVQLHTMRMRLAIPKCARDELDRITKMDGAPVPRI